MSESKAPPPIPRPVRYVHFEGEATGFHTPDFDLRRMEAARSRAVAWINANPEIEVISIDSSFGMCLAIVTVWYR